MTATNMLPAPSHQHPYSSASSSDEGTTAHLRPKLARQDTEQFLSYYESALANEGSGYILGQGPSASPEKGSVTRPQLHGPQTSTGSTSSSDYSSDSVVSEKDARKDSYPEVRRRSSIPSEGGADRRRLAIVQMDSLGEDNTIPKMSSEHGHDNNNLYSPNNLRSRRGLETHLGDLALVAPPDAAPRTYTHLTPPSTAPITGTNDWKTQDPEPNQPPVQDKGGHHRSASEAVVPNKRGLHHKGSRDVGIVGTGRASFATDRPKQPQPHLHVDNRALRPPIFQMPQSRSPSPGGISDTSDSSHNLPSALAAQRQTSAKSDSTTQLIVTSEIGQEKDIHVPVASSVIVNLGPANISRVGPSSSERESPTPQIVVDSSPLLSHPFSPTKPTSYLHYQPGVHATAGPLPPPPMAIFNIDTNSPPPPRPPRLHSPPPSRRRGDIEAVKQALQLPPSVSAALALKSPTPPSTKESSNPPKLDISTPVNVDTESDSSISSTSTHSSQLHASKSVHRREGAFSPSTTLSSESTTPSDSDTSVESRPQPTPPEPPQLGLMDELVADVGNAIDDIGVMSALEVPPPNVVEPPRRSESLAGGRPGLELHRNGSWVSISPELTPSLEESRRASADLSLRPSSCSPPHTPRGPDSTPSPPPKSFRNSFTTGLKRFSSLPRSPSYKSFARSSSIGRSSRASRTPSPSALPPLPEPRRRIISQWPAAMYCADVLAKKSALERCIGYAEKINELYMYDCGLGDWVIGTNFRGPGSRSPKKRTTLMPSAPSTQSFHPQVRHTSHSSIVSEATFPRRPDASTATDLSARGTRDITPPGAPPILPYPSLAQTPRGPPRSATTLGTSPSFTRTLAAPAPTPKPTGFFSSLGRKTSIRKDKSGPTSPTSSSSGKLLTKSQPTNPNPRPVNIPNNPSVPGGPRAPPNRMLRSQTIMISSPFSSNSQSSFDRTTSLARRPSLFTMSPSDQVVDIHADSEFVRQVDKLADLLPHVDRDILAGYLRRSGQDVLAIGQYLEDEKNGTIRHD